MCGSPEEVLVSPECSVRPSRRMKVTRIILDGYRSEIRPNNRDSERFYYVIDGRGTLAQRIGNEVGDAEWKMGIEGGTAIWMPPGVQHGLVNLGDGPLRLVEYSVTLDAGELKAERESPTSPRIVQVLRVAPDNAVTFLSRVAFEAARLGAKAFTLSEFETLHPGGSVICHAHSDSEEIYYIVRGTGTSTVNGTRTKYKAGQCVYIGPGQSHQMNNEGEEVLEYILGQAKVK